MKVIISGASGQFGRSAVEKLMARMPPTNLILVSRTPDKLADFAARGADVRFGDFDQPETLVEAFRGGERLLLISGTRVGKRIPQHQAAIDAAVTAGVLHIVYTSFVGVTPENPSVAVVDHRATEEMLRNSGLEWTALRDQHYADAMVINMGQNIVRAGQWLSSTQGGKEALVWREDCVECAVAVLTGEGHENKVYNITGPELLSFRDIATMITEVSGRPIEFIDTDDEGMYAMFDAMGVPREPVDRLSVSGIDWNSDDMVSFEAAIRDGHFAVISSDVEKLTGRKPRSVRQMVEDNADLLRMA